MFPPDVSVLQGDLSFPEIDVLEGVPAQSGVDLRNHGTGQSQLPQVSVEGMSVVCVVRYVRMISATRFARSRFSLCLRE